MKELLIIRHAVAYERDPTKWPDDDERPLSLAGKKKFRKFAKRLQDWLPTPRVVLCSPLDRARQTARILYRRANFPKPKTIKTLRPEASTRSLITELARRSERCIAIVGHEPSLSRLVAALLGLERPAKGCQIKKGAVVWLAFKNNGIKAGDASLVCYLPTRLAKRQ